MKITVIKNATIKTTAPFCGMVVDDNQINKK